MHGVVVELSPFRKSKHDEYFDGQISDGKDCVGLVSFELVLWPAMRDSLEKKDTVSLVGCQVRSGRGGESDIILSRATKVERSPKSSMKRI